MSGDFRFRAEAQAFRIWREGTSVGWDCTAKELADAVNLPASRVRRICLARGWKLNPPATERAYGGVARRGKATPVDRLVRVA